jgi:peptide/nickel transport system permease protein
MNMLYILKKFSRALLTVLLIVTTVFVVLRLSGDPAIYVLGLDADPRALDAFRQQWGLNLPIWQQYLQFLGNCLQGDFGYSYFEERDAITAVLERLPKTLQLMGITGLCTLLIGIPAGIYAALHRNSWIDRLTMLVSVAGFSLPNFVLGIFLILLFSVTWQLLPTSGSGSWQHLVMPVLTMTVAEAAVFARFTRSRSERPARRRGGGDHSLRHSRRRLPHHRRPRPAVGGRRSRSPPPGAGSVPGRWPSSAPVPPPVVG